jgi:hypothetical protein
MMLTTRIFGSTRASIGSRIHGELAERNLPGMGE